MENSTDVATLEEPEVAEERTFEGAWSPEDLLKISDRPMPELVDGELVERAMGQESDAVASRLIRLIGRPVDEHKLGLINGSQGSYQIFPDEPKKVRIPDVSFTRAERVPATGPAAGHSRVAPDLVVEVISPNDLAVAVQQKIGDYRSAGVPLIWVVYPGSRTILVVRKDGTALHLGVGEFLDGEDVLTGFRCEVGSVFD